MTSRTTADQVLRVQHHLTGRDWRLLGWLYDHDVLTSFQITQALFPSLNYAQRRLTELTGRPTYGVLPWSPDVWLDSEDALDLATRGEAPPSSPLRSEQGVPPSAPTAARSMSTRSARWSAVRRSRRRRTITATPSSTTPTGARSRR